MNKILSDKLRDLPHSPGVYLFKNTSGKVIYVGKAKNLKNRVSSYFQKNLGLGTKTAALVARIEDLELVKTELELEALVLEAELIKKHYPKYNIVFKDDKSYLYIVVRNDVFKEDGITYRIPKVLTARKTDLKEKDVTFGPYPSGSDARAVVKNMRKVFPFRDCSLSKLRRYRKLDRPCLYGQIGLCSAPCLKSTNIKNYRNDISKLKKFLSGNGTKLVREYEKKMKEASKEQEYEDAAKYRDYLKKLQYVRESYKTAYQYIENPNLIEDLANEALEELTVHIKILDKKPRRIECYDISTLSGKESVGSMVVALDGQIDKREYKRFKIKLKDSPDDFFMMKEVLERRLRRSSPDYKGKEKWEKPDLLVMDGGKGQVSTVAKVLKELQVDIPLIGLAKRFETIIYQHEGKFVELKLPHDNEGLKLIIRLRDEAHRFAQSYHHYLRLKTIRDQRNKV